jgi:broad specificity phosphatase PhoE
MAKGKVYFVRHGQSQANLGKVYANFDSPLTELGLEQARAVAGQLADKKISLIIASDMVRAKQTAEEIAAGLGYDPAKIRLDSRLREVGVGNLVGQTSHGMPGYLDHLANPHGDTTFEPLETAKSRANSLLAGLAEHQGNILLVSHNGFGCVLQACLTGDDSQLDGPGMANAAFVELDTNMIGKPA